MNQRQQAVARQCLGAAEDNSLTFPEIVGRLIEAGFDSYWVDFRRGTATYYLPDGAALDLPAHRSEVAVAAAFDTPALQAAVRDAQALAPGYTYRGFCDRAKAAGCAGYLVSFGGRRALYLGRDGATHTEYFPG
ncbi:DUF1398 domain-containing protein [Sphingoaurantiacus capsulatus]|uniref:DUF1398 domain-containing protein n=1 Tax=Sphingoaurantiacus capsulatus TaxID=1771310 RepID=A0ABV7X6L7_9SPHN